MAAENMRKVETIRRKTLEKLRRRWYLVALRVIIDSVDLAEPDRRSTIAMACASLCLWVKVL